MCRLTIEDNATAQSRLKENGKRASEPSFVLTRLLDRFVANAGRALSFPAIQAISAL